MAETKICPIISKDVHISFIGCVCEFADECDITLKEYLNGKKCNAGKIAIKSENNMSKLAYTLPTEKREDTAILRIVSFKDGSVEFAMFTTDGKTELGHVTIENAKQALAPYLK